MSKQSNNSSRPVRRGPMGGMHGGHGPAEKAKNFKGTMIRLIRYLKPYRINILISFLFSILFSDLYGRGTKDLGKCNDRIDKRFYGQDLWHW